MATFTTETGLTLDDTDPEDRKILARQRDAARASGRTGGDRAGATRGRADLASAFDEGAAEAAAPSAPAAAGKTAAAGAAKARSGKKRGAAAAAATTARSIPTPTLRPPRTANLKDASGFALGMVLHALVVSYIRYGAEGPKGWLKAKFLNKPIQGSDLEGPKGPNGEEAAEGEIDPSKPII